MNALQGLARSCKALGSPCQALESPCKVLEPPLKTHELPPKAHERPCKGLHVRGRNSGSLVRLGTSSEGKGVYFENIICIKINRSCTNVSQREPENTYPVFKYQTVMSLTESKVEMMQTLHHAL